MIDRYDILAEHQDERVKITGVFERFGFITQHYREIKTALLQDVYAHIDGKDLDIGHAWLQNADQLKSLGLNFGDRIQCNCRVKTYKKRLLVPNRQGLMVENKLSLCWPTEVELISRLQPPPLQNDLSPVKPTEQIILPPPQLPSQEAKEQMTPAKVIAEVRRVAKLSGGWDALQELVQAIRAEA